jgi:hypothetical protein
VTASVGRRFGERSVLRLTAGAILGGELAGEGFDYELGTGWVAGISGAHRMFGLPEQPQFVTLTLSFGASSAPIRERQSGESDRLAASDLRFGLLAGATLWKLWSPYALARVFGGPVTFRQGERDRTGSDRHHYASGRVRGARRAHARRRAFDRVLSPAVRGSAPCRFAGCSPALPARSPPDA